MTTERLSMRHTREVLRLTWVLGRNHRELARSLGISNGAVGITVVRARAVATKPGLREAQSNLDQMLAGSSRTK